MRGGWVWRRIGGRLLAGYLAVIALLLVAWAIGAGGIAAVRSNYVQSVQTVDALANDVAQYSKLMDDEETGLRGYLLTGRTDFLQPYLAAERTLPPLRQRIAALLARDASLGGAFPLVDQRAALWHLWARRTLAARASGGAASVSNQLTGKALFDSYRHAAERITAELNAQRSRGLSSSLDTVSRVNGRFTAIFLLAVALMALIGWLTTRAVTRPLTQLGQAAERVGQGDLASPIAVGGTVEFVRLSTRMDHMRAELGETVRALHTTNADLTQRGEELAAANNELEAFSYSVSHDLRSPLRAIDGFSRILLDEHAAELGSEARRYLGIVRENAQRMGLLIDDLLAFSRLSRQPLVTQTVNLEALARLALEELRSEWQGRQVEVVIGDLPPCQADPNLLKQVLLNLLGNALKYTRGREEARVEVGSCLRDGERTYWVKDNGAGFDMRYADKLFGVFQRLHRAEEYEGTGVGLAIVQRIVHRHGGRVWAEAAVGEGATFYFTLGGSDTA